MRNHAERKYILVIGGANFLDSHLIEQLLVRGNQVICADNLFTGTRRKIKYLDGHSCSEFLCHLKDGLKQTIVSFAKQLMGVL